MKKWLLLRLGAATLLLAFATACTATAATTTSGGALVVNSQAAITARIIEVESNPSGYPWRIDLQLLSAQNVNDLPNPVSSQVGLEIIAYTDQNVNDLRAGQSVSARVKLTGDVPQPGITLYIYDIKAQ